MSKMQTVEQIDTPHLKGFKIVQNKNFFKFGIDAVLLENFVKVRRDEQIVDFCSGNGIIPILLCAEHNIKMISGIEIQSEVADLFLKSVRLNKLEEKINVINDDIKNVRKYFLPQSVNVVTCNPPYIKAQNLDKNKNDFLSVARHEILCTLEDVMKNASYVLKPAGRFYLIHRPERLAEFFLTGKKYNLEAKRLRFVQPKEGKIPSMVLMEFVKCAGQGIIVEPPLIVYSDDGEYSEEVKRIYRLC